MGVDSGLLGKAAASWFNARGSIPAPVPFGAGQGPDLSSGELAEATVETQR
jgi:hypothetical protein